MTFAKEMSNAICIFPPTKALKALRVKKTKQL